MLAELGAFLRAVEEHGVEAAQKLIVDENLLGKSSDAARDSAVANLNKLYALNRPPPITRAMARLWQSDQVGRPLLAMLCALARDPLFRDTADTVTNARFGDGVRWPALADAIAAKHPDRFSQAMLKSMAQNCASSWTQSGHLNGLRNKVRQRVEATPEVVTFAALIAEAAGFGGPGILSSPWLTVLDAGEEERLGLLRRAQGRGLVRARHAGAVFELKVSPDLTADFA
ncbi:MAG: hypothetical protein C0481_15480 [Phenylobacterium sp.]|uniref:hypothetical protein n=1 Tax=Phenylobacterium sp. TaxID=1871053 RepID=UPI0025EA1A22|nr:hypothetical protein [Phenylobacterium sp.]MBA4013266.1 hypothetical protein [Phenylobacterium sp.]